MGNKTIKQIYTIILISVMVISCCLGMQLYVENNKIVINNGTNIEDMEDMFEDDKNSENPENSENSEDSENKTDSTQQPIYSNGFKCVEDSYKIIDNGKGFKTISILSGQADIFGIGTVTQTSKETVTLSGNYYFKETYTSCTSSLGQTYYRYFYSVDDGKNVEYKKTSTYDENEIPDWNYLIEKDNLPKEEIIKYDGLAYDVFAVRSNKDNSTLIKFDRSTNEKYYIVSFILDVDKISQKYIDNMIREGNLKSLKINSLKLTYYIEKETLYMRKIEKVENYDVDVGIKVNFDAYQETVITVVDKEMIVEKPYYC